MEISTILPAQQRVTSDIRRLGRLSEHNPGISGSTVSPLIDIFKVEVNSIQPHLPKHGGEDLVETNSSRVKGTCE
jgi:hypothetical protein